MRDDFNKEAMKEKIRLNIEKGFSLSQIRRLLQEEKLGFLEKMATMEARVMELSDQIEFITTEYVHEPS